MAFLDVRPDLEQGREPFSRIMDAVSLLLAGESLELVAPFEPIPLYRVMEAKGFEYEATRAQDGSWHVLFRPMEPAQE